MAVVGLVLAAGSGRRLAAAVPKAFAILDGEPILVRAVRAVADGGVDRIVVVVPEGRVEEAAIAVGALPELARSGPPPAIVAGGATRVDSVRLGLASDHGAEEDVIVVHDAARPFAVPGLFRRVLQAIQAGADAATVTLPSVDTLAEVDGAADDAHRRIVGAPDRARLVRVQTPQAFRRSVLVLAHERAAVAGDTTSTDDCGLVLRHVPGARVIAVPGDERNLKITTPEDLAQARRHLSATADPAAR